LSPLDRLPDGPAKSLNPPELAWIRLESPETNVGSEVSRAGSWGIQPRRVASGWI